MLQFYSLSGAPGIFAKHDDRQGHHDSTPSSQAEANVYSSDDPGGHHAHCGLAHVTTFIVPQCLGKSRLLFSCTTTLRNATMNLFIPFMFYVA